MSIPYVFLLFILSTLYENPTNQKSLYIDNSLHNRVRHAIVLDQQEDTITFFNGTLGGCLGFPYEESWEFAVRFPGSAFGPYAGYNVTAVVWYHGSGYTSGQIKIYDSGTPSSPGAVLTTEDYTCTNGWIRVDLTTTVPVDGDDLWASVDAVGDSFSYPAGFDSGPSAGPNINWAFHPLYIDANLSLMMILSPSQQSEDTLHYDGEYYTDIGCPDYFIGAIRLTINEYQSPCTLMAVTFYHASNDTDTVNAHIGYQNDSIREPYVAIDTGWHRINLTNPYYIDGTSDLWIGIEVFSSTCSLGVDMGPHVPAKSDWLYFNGSWTELYTYGYNYNWNIRPIVHRNTSTIEEDFIETINDYHMQTIFNGPIYLQNNHKYKIYDITGRQIHTLNPPPGVYYIQIDNQYLHKVIKIR